MSEQEKAEGTEQTQQTEAAPEAKVQSEGEKRYEKDVKRYKDQSKEFQSKYEDAINRLSALEKEKLKTTEDYKGLAERLQSERDQAEARAKKVQESFMSSLKVSALERKALEAGIKPEYLEFLYTKGLEGLEIETTSHGNANVLGADNVVNEFKTRWPDAFKSPGAKMNYSSPTAGTTKMKEMTPAELVDLQTKNPSQYRDYMSKLISRKN